MRGDKRKRGSRWELERERFRIESFVAPSPGGEPEPVSDTVRDLMKRLGLADRQWYGELEAEWRELIGASVATHTRPGFYREGVLTVFVDHSIWLAELSRYGKREMLTKLQARFGKDRLRQIILKLDPD